MKSKGWRLTDKQRAVRLKFAKQYNGKNGMTFFCRMTLQNICFSCLIPKLTVFLELRSRKTVRFSEQIMSKDKYPSIFSLPN